MSDGTWLALGAAGALALAGRARGSRALDLDALLAEVQQAKLPSDQSALASLTKRVHHLRRKLDAAKSPFDVHDLASERNKLEWGFERKLSPATLAQALSPIDHPALQATLAQIQGHLSGDSRALDLDALLAQAPETPSPSGRHPCSVHAYSLLQARHRHRLKRGCQLVLHGPSLVGAGLTHDLHPHRSVEL